MEEGFYALEGVQMHWKGPIYGYISTKWQGYIFKGDFYYILISGGGKSRGIYIIELEISMNL